jgi:hypothetical protein
MDTPQLNLRLSRAFCALILKKIHAFVGEVARSCTVEKVGETLL